MAGLGADAADTEMVEFSMSNPMHAPPAVPGPGPGTGTERLRGERQPPAWQALYAATADVAGAAWARAGAAAAAAREASLGVVEQAADAVGQPLALTAAARARQHARAGPWRSEGYHGVPQASTHGGGGMVAGSVSDRPGGQGGYVPPTFSFSSFALAAKRSDDNDNDSLPSLEPATDPDIEPAAAVDILHGPQGTGHAMA